MVGPDRELDPARSVRQPQPPAVAAVDDRLDTHPDKEAEHTGLKRTDGLIGLQGHNGRVEFRNLRVKELKPARER